MNVLITGGAGYIGGALTDALTKTNHNVRVYDALVYEDDYRKDIPFVLGDVRDYEHLKKHVGWADVIVWLAALVGDGACALNPKISTAINQDSVRWLSENFDGRILFTSTCSVYGMRDGVLTEHSPTHPLSVYGSTKRAAEDYLSEKNAIIFRLGTLFGLGDRFSRVRLDLVVNTLTSRAVADHKLAIFGGNQFRPLLHVRDAAEAIVQNLTTTHTGIFNLHRRNSRMIDLARKVTKLVPNTEIKVVDMHFEDQRNYRVSSLKAQKAFGFKPKLRIEDGIVEIKNLFEEKRIKNPACSRYTNEGHLAGFNNHMVVDGKPKLIEGALAVDDRGQIVFANDFTFKGVKRFYMVSNHKEGFVRAWHAHQKEAKFVTVVRGSALVGIVPINNWKKPDKKANVERFVLSTHKPQILYIPPGYANGFMSLTPDTKILFYSTSTLEESQSDDFRYDSRYWDIWSVKER